MLIILKSFNILTNHYLFKINSLSLVGLSERKLAILSFILKKKNMIKKKKLGMT